MSALRPFLTARWRHLAMLNYVVDPSLVRPLLPPGTEMDTVDGKTYASLVGFMFLDTRVRGWAIPFHRSFEEVNLRIYVRRKAEEGWRRGVTFVKEIVPRAAIAWVARTVYGENYVALPMSHRWSPEDPPAVRYAWRVGEREMSIELEPDGPYRPIAPASPEEFIAEHYWGYCRQPDGGSLEYHVEHPPWRVWPVADAAFSGDAGALYRAEFAAVLAKPPDSVLLAEGSPVKVYRGRRLE